MLPVSSSLNECAASKHLYCILNRTIKSAAWLKTDRLFQAAKIPPAKMHCVAHQNPDTTVLSAPCEQRGSYRRAVSSSSDNNVDEGISMGGIVRRRIRRKSSGKFDNYQIYDRLFRFFKWCENVELWFCSNSKFHFDLMTNFKVDRQLLTGMPISSVQIQGRRPALHHHCLARSSRQCFSSSAIMPVSCHPFFLLHYLSDC